MNKAGTPLYGPLNVFGRMFELLIDIVQNSFKILSLELREEKIHFIQIFLMATIVMFLAVLTFVVITFTIIFALPEPSRLVGLIVASGVFLVATAVLVLLLVRKLSQHPIPFTHAIHEMTEGTE